MGQIHITQQDRQLAERIANECITANQSWQSYGLWDNDKAASLLAEAREAQHKASWAMAIEAARRCTIPRVYGRDATVQDLRNAIRAIPVTEED